MGHRDQWRREGMSDREIDGVEVGLIIGGIAGFLMGVGFGGLVF